MAATDTQFATVSVQVCAVVSQLESVCSRIWLSGTFAAGAKSSCRAAIMLPAPVLVLLGATAMTLLPACRYGLTLTSCEVRQPLATFDDDTCVPLIVGAVAVVDVDPQRRAC